MNGFYSKIVGPFDTVNYSGLIIENYQKKSFQGLIMRTPFVGFKILMRDNDASRGRASERIRYLETYTPYILSGTGCFLRETNNHIMPDGFWLVTLPVPITQLNDYNYNQINRVMNTIKSLETTFNITRQGRVEINVSGRCTVPETEARLKSVYIPEDIKPLHMTNDNSAYVLGSIQRINNNYTLMRTSWDFSSLTNDSMRNAMVQMAYNISGMYR